MSSCYLCDADGEHIIDYGGDLIPTCAEHRKVKYFNHLVWPMPPPGQYGNRDAWKPRKCRRIGAS